jgi:hypothetical protein
MDLQEYIEFRITNFESKLVHIDLCLTKQRELPVGQMRDRNIIGILDKHKMAYNLCISELETLREIFNGK